MEQANLTIRNVDVEVIELLRDIRKSERRQLAAILEECVRDYWGAYYDEPHPTGSSLEV